MTRWLLLLIAVLLLWLEAARDDVLRLTAERDAARKLWLA